MEKINYASLMNGYRDPVTREEEAQRQRLERAFNPFMGGSRGFDSSSGERECGYREEGGTYAEVPKSRDGKPLEHFITCVPVPIDRDEYRLHPKGLGVTLVDVPEACLTCEGGGETVIQSAGRSLTGACSECGGVGLVPVTHVFDIVGEGNYPNVADFLEEARRRGVSRRLELEVSAYARLTSRSRLIMLHNRACIFNPESYYLEMQPLELQRLARAGCPKYHPQHKIEKLSSLHYLTPGHDTPLPGCAALWWHDLDKGKPTRERAPEVKDCPTCAGVGIINASTKDFDAYDCGECNASGKIEIDNPPGRFVERQLKSGTYRGYSRPDGAIPRYGLGIFAVFPLVKIVVIDAEGKYEDRVKRARNAKVQVDVEEY